MELREPHLSRLPSLARQYLGDSAAQLLPEASLSVRLRRTQACGPSSSGSRLGGLALLPPGQSWPVTRAGMIEGPGTGCSAGRNLVQNSMQLDCQLASSGIDLRCDAGYDDPRAAQLEGGAADWMLLLQVDTDDKAGWMWGDCGTLYYWIRRPDLLAGRFDRVWMIFQCC